MDGTEKTEQGNPEESNLQDQETAERLDIVKDNVDTMMKRREKRKQDPRYPFTTDGNISASSRELTAMSALRGMVGEQDPFDIQTQVKFGDRSTDFQIALMPNPVKGSVMVKMSEGSCGFERYIGRIIARGDADISAGQPMIEADLKDSRYGKVEVEKILDSAIQTTAVNLGYQGK